MTSLVPQLILVRARIQIQFRSGVCALHIILLLIYSYNVFSDYLFVTIFAKCVCNINAVVLYVSFHLSLFLFFTKLSF